MKPLNRCKTCGGKPIPKKGTLIPTRWYHCEKCRFRTASAYNLETAREIWNECNPKDMIK